MNLEERLKQLSMGNPLIVGMGNYLRCDDAVGLYIIDSLIKNRGESDVPLLNVEDVLESYVYKIADMDCREVVIIDAVEAGMETGEVLFGKFEDFNEIFDDLSTHKLSLMLCGKIMREYGKVPYLLGIEPASIDYGTDFSEVVKDSADVIIDLLMSSILCKGKERVYEY